MRASEIAELMGQMLEISDMALADNFFEVGGNSLLALQLIAQLEDRSDLKIALLDLVRAPTPEQLAARLADRYQHEGETGLPGQVSPPGQVTMSTPAGPKTIWELFARQAQQEPSATAVSGEASYTYEELSERALGVARTLLEHCEPGSLVALDATGPATALIAFLAAAKARCALLPLNADSPPLHRTAVLADAQADVLLREQPGHSLTVERIGGVGEDGAPGRWPHTMIDVAYVIYTSGSTGRPKGVVIPHQALLDRLRGLARVPGLHRGESFLAITAVSFDISVAELLLPLLVGGRVVAAPVSARLDPAIFAAVVDEHRPDVIQSTPSSWRLALAWGWPGAADSRLWCGGEPLTPALAGRLLRAGAELWNVYGPTEATIWASAARILPGEPIGIGRPLDGTGLCLADEAGLVVTSPGQAGEILLYGDGLALGYLNQPDLTALRFRTQETPDGPRLCYHTGDRAQYRDDGALEFLGRSDGQVKLRGYRIELGELESVLEGHPAVHEAAALLRDADIAEKAHIAVYLASDGTLTTRDLRTWLTERLPSHMHPSRIYLRPSLPRTTAGKIDRVTLANAPAEDGAGMPEPGKSAAPAARGRELTPDKVRGHDG